MGWVWVAANADVATAPVLMVLRWQAVLPLAEFESHRDALIAQKLAKDHSLGEETERHWSEISEKRWVGNEGWRGVD